MMEDRLVSNIRVGLDRAGIDANIDLQWSRPFIAVDEGQIARATEVASETFGVVSASPSLCISRDRDEIVSTVAEVATETYERGTFAVRARRADKRLPYTSGDLEREAGSAVFEAVQGQFDPEVDLDDPDITFHIEVRREHAYVFTDIVAGVGGLPVGTQAPMVALISGGIDSPVAAYRIMRRGSPIIPVYVDLGTYGGADHQARALEAIARLHSYAGAQREPAYIVPAGDIIERFVAEVDAGRMLLLRRFMFMIAEHIARDVGAVGIVTGEALGQKSSQTATNFEVTGMATELPIHRPLLTMDKVEITDIARDIGTFRSSTVPTGCPTIAPDRVMTKASVADIDQLEPDDFDQLTEMVVERAEVLEPTNLSPYAKLSPG